MVILQVGLEHDVHRTQRAPFLGQLVLGTLDDDVTEIAVNQLEPIYIRSRQLLEDLDEHSGQDVDVRLRHPPARSVKQ